MHRTKGDLTRRGPSRPRSKIVPALLGLAIVVAGFALLMVRLEVTQQGYRLSALASENRTLTDRNQRLRLEVAQLSSHERLRSLALAYGMGPPPPDHVVIAP